MVEFLQLILLLLAIALALATARSGHDIQPSPLVGLVRRFSAKQGLVVASIGLSSFLGCLGVACFLHEPVPRVPDEFSYLLLGDTFASGAVAFNTTVPVSSSEPAILSAVPLRITSCRAVEPVITVADLAKSVVAC